MLKYFTKYDSVLFAPLQKESQLVSVGLILMITGTIIAGCGMYLVVFPTSLLRGCACGAVGLAVLFGGAHLKAHAEHIEALARPSMDIRACKPGDPISCTTATDVVGMTPQPDGTLYVEFRDGGWMTGAFIEADESDITVTNVRCNGSSTTKAASDGTPVTMTLCSSNYTFGSR